MWGGWEQLWYNIHCKVTLTLQGQKDMAQGKNCQDWENPALWHSKRESGKGRYMSQEIQHTRSLPSCCGFWMSYKFSINREGERV